MAEAPKHVQFFGDQERSFALTPELVLELERITGSGIGGLCQRLFRSDFKLADISATIRLGLIGGGASPEDAAGLVAAYAQSRPLAETFPLAVAILETLWFGAAKTQVEDDQDEVKA
ncbi:MAG: gene transfer agent family protein [Alphaproteobacteria bacterium]|nr:gene transfer agent family protein [Alphaproteobacteria bacterium]